MTPEKIFRMEHLNPACEACPGVRFVLCGETYPNRNYSISRPASPVFCAEYIISGKGTLVLDGKTFQVGAGDTYLLPAGHDQYYYADRNDPWDKIWVNFGGETAQALAGAWKLDGNPVYPGLDSSDLLLQFQREANAKDPAGASERCQAILSQLFCRMADSRVSSRDREDRTPVRKMLDWIDRNAAGDITVDGLAKVSGKSPSQSERLFRREVGMPVYRYVLTKKIALAKQLLAGTGMSVQEIAAYLSFEDPFYFSGLFRKKVGVSPSQYRKSGAEKGGDGQNDPEKIRENPKK